MFRLPAVISTLWEKFNTSGTFLSTPSTLDYIHDIGSDSLIASLHQMSAQPHSAGKKDYIELICNRILYLSLLLMQTALMTVALSPENSDRFSFVQYSAFALYISLKSASTKHTFNRRWPNMNRSVGVCAKPLPHTNETISTEIPLLPKSPLTTYAVPTSIQALLVPWHPVDD